MISIGSDAVAVADRWLAEIGARPATFWSLEGESAPELLPELTSRLRQSATGLRLMVAGPEQDVLAIQSCALAEGMIAAELNLFATSADTRSLYCAHCKTTSSVRAEFGAVARCSGCGRGLLVYSHLSRRSGSYLGFHFEERP